MVFSGEEIKLQPRHDNYILAKATIPQGHKKTYRVFCDENSYMFFVRHENNKGKTNSVGPYELNSGEPIEAKWYGQIFYIKKGFVVDVPYGNDATKVSAILSCELEKSKMNQLQAIEKFMSKEYLYATAWRIEYVDGIEWRYLTNYFVDENDSYEKQKGLAIALRNDLRESFDEFKDIDSLEEANKKLEAECKLVEQIKNWGFSKYRFKQFKNNGSIITEDVQKSLIESEEKEGNE